MKHLKWLAAGLGAVVGSSCYNGTYDYYDPYYYDYAYYDPYYYGYDTAYAYSWVDPIYDDFYSWAQGGGPSQPPNVIDLASVASTIAARTTDYYGAGCVTAAPSGPTVSFAFMGCTGPLGVEAISGNVLLTLSQSGDQIVMTATSTDLTVGGEPYILDLDATAAGASSAGKPGVLTISSRSRSPARLYSRQTQATVTWERGGDCVDVEGQGQSARGTLSATATLSGFRICGDSCPASGTLVVNAPSGGFTASFDGSNKVAVTAPNGDTRTYNLNCR
jgi:hypothetical protein